ncbi:hypothetical protein [Paenibacillus sp. P22]|nr:hypothetical protein [Paenibacillus sp. P22]
MSVVSGRLPEWPPSSTASPLPLSPRAWSGFMSRSRSTHAPAAEP